MTSLRTPVLFAVLTLPAAAQTWSAAHPDQPATKSAYAMAVAEESGENQIFVMGGYDGAASDDVWRFHRTYGWSVLGDMPGARSRTAAATLTYGGAERIHLVGGGSGGTLATTTHWSYDPLADTWETSPAPMVKALYDMEAVAAPNGKLYVFGGISSTGATSDTTQVYDPVTDSWTAGFYMPQDRTRFAAVSDCDGYIYVFGGIDGATYRNTVECFDTTTHTWLPANPHTGDPMPDIPTSRDRLAGALGRDGRIYLTGGTPSTGPSAMNIVEAYDPYSNTWSTEPSMLSARHDHRAVGLGTRVWVPGGLTHSSYSVFGLESFGGLSYRSACADDVPTLPFLHGGLTAASATPYDFVSSMCDYLVGHGSPQWFSIDLSAQTSAVVDVDVTGLGAISLRAFDGANQLVASGSESHPLHLGGANAPAGRYYVQVRVGGQGQQPVPYSLFASTDADHDPIGDVYASPAISNSTGVPATIGAEGFTLASANDVTLAVGHLPLHSAGYFLVSSQAGAIVNPGTSSGVLPLVGNIGRFAGDVLNSGPTGDVSLRIDLAQLPGNPPVAVQAGQTWNFSYWYRDVGPNGVTSNFADGIAITFE